MQEESSRYICTELYQILTVSSPAVTRVLSSDTTCCYLYGTVPGRATWRTIGG